MDDQWLTTKELAARMKVPESTVRYWRQMGDGPPGTRFGKGVRYRLSDVVKWEKRKAADEAAGNGHSARRSREKSGEAA